MLRLATQKRRLKAKVQEIRDDDILEVEDVISGEHRVPTAEVIAAFPNFAHDEPTSPFLGKIGSWKLPPPPRLPVLSSLGSLRQTSSPDSSVPPVALAAARIPTPRHPPRKAATSPTTSTTATQKVRAVLGEVTENTLLIVQGRPSIAWATGLLAIGMCFGAFLARPGRSESAAIESLAVTQAAQESAAPEVLMAMAPTRAPTVSEVAVPVVVAPPAPVQITVPLAVALPKVVTAKPAVVAHAPAAPAKPIAKKAPLAPEPSARTTTKDPTVADALAREQLKSALR